MREGVEFDRGQLPRTSTGNVAEWRLWGYDIIVKEVEKGRHVLEPSKPDVYRFAVACQRLRRSYHCDLGYEVVIRPCE